MEINGRTILITGGGTGIGRALAEALHDSGNTVIIAGRRQSVLDEVAAARPGIETATLDIADSASITSAIEQVVAEHPDLDILINNAGVSAADDPSAPLDDAEANRMIETNLLGSIRVSGALVEHLKTRPDALIVYNTSTLPFVPIAMRAVYSATKAALHSYAHSQRFMLRDSSVRVAEILPPWVNTCPQMLQGSQARCTSTTSSVMFSLSSARVATRLSSTRRLPTAETQDPTSMLSSTPTTLE